MLRLATDENFDARLLRGLALRLPQLDVMRVQDVGLSGAPDPKILGWAAAERRVLLTHDAKTMPHFATLRVRAGEPLAGVVLVPRRLPLGPVIEDLVLLVDASRPDDLVDEIVYLPL